MPPITGRCHAAYTLGILLLIPGLAAYADSAAPPATTQAFGSLTPSWLDFANTERPWKTWLTVPIATRHFDRQAVVDHNLSEHNPGLGLERSNGEWHWKAGAFRNSLRQNSVYGLLGYTPFSLGWSPDSRLSMGGFIGLTTGYQNTQKGYPVIPVGGALLSLETSHRIGLNVIMVPTVTNFQVFGFAAVEIKVSF